MAVTEQTPSNSSTGNGVTTVFPYTFKILAAADLEVTVDGAVKTLNTDYTVSGAGDDAGGNVTFTTAPADLTTVVRRRSMAYTRSTDYQYQGDLPNDVLNADQDAPILMIQQLAEEVGRSLKAPVGEGAMDVLPDAEGRANKFLVFDAGGNPSTSSGTGADAGLREELAATTGAALVSWLRSGTGPIIRTLQSKVGDFLHLADFTGASEFDGSSDYTADFLEALLWVKTRNYGGRLILPSGSCPISDTLPLDISGLHLLGEGADEGRASWGKWPTRLKWIGATGKKMLEIDPSVTGLVRGGTIEGIVLDAQDTSGVHPLYANPNSAHWRLKNVCLRNYGAGSGKVYLGTSCFGWLFDDVEIFNSQHIGIHLEGLNHHTTFRRVRGSGTGVTAATSLIRIGESDRCSNINIEACDFEAPNTGYQVELLNCRAVNVCGGYSEVSSSGITAIFRLGVTAGSSCEGFAINGHYVQGNDPTYTTPYVINALNASGVDIGGGNHFRNITTAVVNSPAACPNSRFGAGNYLENCGGSGNKVKFASLTTGWSFHDSGTTTPAIVGTGGAANNYTTQKCQWWVRDGRCFFDVEITLSALNSTGPLQVETSIPYTAASNYDYACQVVSYTGLTLAAGSHLRAFVTRGTNDINLREQGGTGGSENTVLNTEATATMSLKVSGNFPIAPGP